MRQTPRGLTAVVIIFEAVREHELTEELARLVEDVEQDLVLLRRDELNQSPRGRLRGNVVETDGTPVFDAFVTASYEEGVYAAVQRTDAEGRFDLGPLPSGVVKIEVFNEKSTLTGVSAGQVWVERCPFSWPTRSAASWCL